MTELEELEALVRRCHDDGMRTAVLMIRSAADRCQEARLPEPSLHAIANLIEETLPHD